MVYRGLYSYRQRVRVITLFPNISYCFCMLSDFANVSERKVWRVQVVICIKKYFQMCFFPRFWGNNGGGGVLSMRMQVILDSFSSPEAALLLVSTKNRDLWPGPTPEVRDSRTYRPSAHAHSQVWQIWLVLVSIYCVYKAIQNRNVVGRGQRSRFLVLTKRSEAPGDENVLDSSFARPGSSPLWGGKKGEFRDWTMVNNECINRL